MASPSRGKATAFSIAAGVVVIVAVTWMRFSGDAKAHLPKLPSRPTQKAKPEMMRNMDYKPEIYGAHLANDSQKFGVDVITAGSMSQPFPYDEVKEPKELTPGKGSIETLHLKISARIERFDAETSKGTFNTEHLFLRIQNRTNRYLVYRVDTTPSVSDQSCNSKGEVSFNAIALPPNGTVDRTECIYRKGMTVTVERVETMQVPELSYYYVSRLFPADLNLQPRTTRSHASPRPERCEHTNAQSLKLAYAKGAVTWRDVVDFFARHRCETYLFPVGYKAITAVGQYDLPVSEDEVR